MPFSEGYQKSAVYGVETGVYGPETDRLRVVAVLHGRRDLKELLGERYWAACEDLPPLTSPEVPRGIEGQHT